MKKTCTCHNYELNNLKVRFEKFNIKNEIKKFKIKTHSLKKYNIK